jgi:hypothetical protein
MNPHPSPYCRPQVLFEFEPEAHAACAERNALLGSGGFYRVVDLLLEDVFDLRGETGFAILWDAEAAAKWRGSKLRSPFPLASLPWPGAVEAGA